MPGEGDPYDLIVVGGGLQGALIAMARMHARPDSRALLVEGAERLGGNHTWCFHAEDVPAEAAAWVEPLVAARWPGYEVRFPDSERRVDDAYACISSERLDAVVRSRAAESERFDLRLSTAVTAVGAETVELANGECLRGGLVVDARGAERGAPPRGAGFQKFVGLELELDRPHKVELPLLMDARVPQLDGYRFLYVLPLTPRRLLVEDTRFADGPALDEDELVASVREYARASGWGAARELRRERGVLPMPWTGSGPRSALRPLQAGYRGNWFHPGTGYSFPAAVRLAAALADASQADVGARLDQLARRLGRAARFGRLLNDLFFRWYPPSRRWRILSRFYRLPSPIVRRFYSMRTTRVDRVRLLVGRPPGWPSLRTRLASSQKPKRNLESKHA